jgi:hypothetical protein
MPLCGVRRSRVALVPDQKHLRSKCPLLSGGHVDSHQKRRLGTADRSFVLGMLAIFSGVAIIGWICYNELLETLGPFNRFSLMGTVWKWAGAYQHGWCWIRTSLSKTQPQWPGDPIREGVLPRFQFTNISAAPRDCYGYVTYSQVSEQLSVIGFQLSPIC